MLIFFLLFSFCYGDSLYTSEAVQDFSHYQDIQQFISEVFRTPHTWVIQFYNPTEPASISTVSEYEKAASHNVGIINFGVVDCVQSKSLCSDLGLGGQLPVILLFKSELDTISAEEGGSEQGGLGKRPRVYGGAATATALSRWAVSFLFDRVIKLTNENFNKELEDKRPKLILFSTKSKVSNLMKSFSTIYGPDHPLAPRSLSVFQVDDSQDAVVKRFGITKYPTLIAVDVEGKEHTYEGKFKYKEMALWIHPFSVPKQNEAEPKSPPPEPEKDEVIHVTDQQSWEKVCNVGWCFIAFLDIEDEGHNNKLEILEIIKNKFSSVKIGWVDGRQSERLKNDFFLADGFPQAVAYYKRKLAARPMRNAFDEELIDEFLMITKSGKARHYVTLDAAPVFEEQKEDL